MRPHLATPDRSACCSATAALARHGQTACWNRDVERIDYYLNPPERGDNQFFTAISSQSDNTNVTLLYPAQASMKEFTQRLYRIRVDLGGATPTGCTNDVPEQPRLLHAHERDPARRARPALQGTYKPASTYPDPGPTYSGGGGQSDGLGGGQRLPVPELARATAGRDRETFATACTNAGGAAQTGGLPAPAWTPAATGSTRSVAEQRRHAGGGVFTDQLAPLPPAEVDAAEPRVQAAGERPAALRAARGRAWRTNGTTGGTMVAEDAAPVLHTGRAGRCNQKHRRDRRPDLQQHGQPARRDALQHRLVHGRPDQSRGSSRTQRQAVPGDCPNGKSGPCDGCNGDFIVLFSDGRGDTANPRPARRRRGVAPRLVQRASPQCSALGMGTEDDGDDFLDPCAGRTARAPPSPARACGRRPAGTCDMDFADDVARLDARNHDGDRHPDHAPNLRGGHRRPEEHLRRDDDAAEIAAAGGGDYVVADDFATLEQNIEHVLMTIINRATSFSAAAHHHGADPRLHLGLHPALPPGRRRRSGPARSRASSSSTSSPSGCTSADYGTEDRAQPERQHQLHRHLPARREQRRSSARTRTATSCCSTPASPGTPAGRSRRAAPTAVTIPPRRSGRRAAELDRPRERLARRRAPRSERTHLHRGPRRRAAATTRRWSRSPSANVATITPLLQAGRGHRRLLHHARGPHPAHLRHRGRLRRRRDPLHARRGRAAAEPATTGPTRRPRLQSRARTSSATSSTPRRCW